MQELNAGWVPMDPEQLHPYEQELNTVLMAAASRGVLASFRTEALENHNGAVLGMLADGWARVEAVAVLFGVDRYDEELENEALRNGYHTVDKFVGIVRDLATRVLYAMQYVREHESLESGNAETLNRVMFVLSSRGQLTKLREEVLALNTAKAAVYQDARGIDSCLRRGWAGLFQNLARKWDRIVTVSHAAEAARLVQREAEQDRAEPDRRFSHGQFSVRFPG